jgi:hypothetical protein
MTNIGAQLDEALLGLRIIGSKVCKFRGDRTIPGPCTNLYLNDPASWCPSCIARHTLVSVASVDTSIGVCVETHHFHCNYGHVMEHALCLEGDEQNRPVCPLCLSNATECVRKPVVVA